MIPRFFCPPEHARLAPGARFPLPEEVAHHAVRVLRLPSGAEITLFDGEGGAWRARLSKVGAGGMAHAEVIAFLPHEVESPLAVTIVQALPESADKMDWIVEKSCELGATAVIPVISQRSVVRLSAERMVRRHAHWQAVAIAACAQCGRNRVPRVAMPRPYFDFLAETRESSALRLLLEPKAETGLSQLSPPAQEILLLIGPEGGFSDEERTAAERVGFLPLALGPRVLRTETAGLAALAALQTLWGDLSRATNTLTSRGRDGNP